jgi:hypothetical protein
MIRHARPRKEFSTRYTHSYSIRYKGLYTMKQRSICCSRIKLDEAMNRKPERVRVVCYPQVRIPPSRPYRASTVLQTPTHQAHRDLPHIRVEAIRGSESLGPIRNNLRNRGNHHYNKAHISISGEYPGSNRPRSTGSAHQVVSSQTSKNCRLWKPVRCRSIHITRLQTCVLPRARFIVSSQEPFQTPVGGTNERFIFQYLFLICLPLAADSRERFRTRQH